MILDSLYNLNCIDLPALSAIMVGDTEIPYVSGLKHLGVVIDNRLTWYAHFVYQAAKISEAFFSLQAKGRNFPALINIK